MDPLTITTTVLGITARCLSTAKTLYSLRGKYQNASITITAIYSETTVIGVSLGKIQSIVLKHQESIASDFQTRPELESTFDSALTGCMLVYSILDDQVLRLSAGGESVFGRAAIVWNEDDMKELLQQIRGQQIALSLLIQMLEMESISEIRGLMQTNSRILTKVSQDVRKLRRSYPRIRAPSSIFELPMNDVESINTAMSSTMFAFDDDVVDSTAYRRALTGGAPKRLGPLAEQSEGDHDDVSSRIDVLRSLLREREEENIKFREQASKLTRSNAMLANQMQQKDASYADQASSFKGLENQITRMRKEVEAEAKRSAKLEEKNARLEKALSRSKTPIMAQVRSLMDRDPPIAPAIYFFAGVNQERAVELSSRSNLTNEDMSLLIVNEDTASRTRENLKRKLEAILSQGNGFPIQKENLALITGGASLGHILQGELLTLFNEVAELCQMVIFWHEGAASMALEDFRRRVKLSDVQKIVPTLIVTPPEQNSGIKPNKVPRMPYDLASDSVRMKEELLRREEEKLIAIEKRVREEINVKRKELLSRESKLKELEARLAREEGRVGIAK